MIHNIPSAIEVQFTNFISACMHANMKFHACRYEICELDFYSRWLCQGWWSRSGRPGDCRTNFLTEIASPTLCFQARSPHISSVQIHARMNVTVRTQQRAADDGDEVIHTSLIHRPSFVFYRVVQMLMIWLW